MTNEPKILGDALKKLSEVESNLCKMKKPHDQGIFFGILFFQISPDTPIENLYKTKTWNGEINHGEIMLKIIREEEKELAEEILKHPILAKRAGLISSKIIK